MADTSGLGTLGGVAGSAAFGPVGGIIGGALGGLAGGLFGPKMKTVNLTPPKRINAFTGALGEATPTSFTFTQPQDRQAAVDAANRNLANIVGGGLAIDPARLNAFREAFFQARSPLLENQLKLRQNALNASVGAKGLTGSSGSILANQLFNEAANRQRQALLNQSIVGAENLANQALNQDVARLNAFGGLSQQDIANRLNAQAGTVGDLFNSQANELAFNNALNNIRLGNVQQRNLARQQRFGNIVGGIGAGFNLGKDIFSGFGGSGSVSVPAAPGGGFFSATSLDVPALPPLVFP